jgi:nucleoside-diphosphate-sugar epimerase
MVNVLEAARICRLKGVVWASSIAVFGRVESEVGPTTDETPPCPTLLYGASKAYCEYLARHYYEHFGVESLGLRYALVYGVGRKRGGSILARDLIEVAPKGVHVKLAYGDESFTWQYVEDVARLTADAAEAVKFEGRSLNTPGEYRSLREVASYVTNDNPIAKINLQPGRTQINWQCQASTVTQELGYAPLFDCMQGVRRSLELVDIRDSEGSMRSVFDL